MPANEELFDAAVRNQHFLIRYGGESANKLISLLDEADADLSARLLRRIDRLGPIDTQQLGRGLATTQRTKALLDEVRLLNRDLSAALRGELKADLGALAELEADIASRRLNEAVGVDLGNLRPAPELLRATAETNIVGGKHLREVFNEFSALRQNQIVGQLRLGIVEGDTTPQIVDRIRQVASVDRGRATLIARTATNQVANAARELVYEANADVVKELRWTATLDHRTTEICMSRDGQVYEIGEGPRPPAHAMCRSIMVPVTYSWDEIAEQGLNAERGTTSIDTLFQQQLAAKGFEPEQIATIKRGARTSLTGEVPATVTYGVWLARQPRPFVEQVLGVGKARLFLDGGLPIRRFADQQTGRAFTLNALKKRYKARWARAHGRNISGLGERAVREAARRAVGAPPSRTAYAKAAAEQRVAEAAERSAAAARTTQAEIREALDRLRADLSSRVTAFERDMASSASLIERYRAFGNAGLAERERVLVKAKAQAFRDDVQRLQLAASDTARRSIDRMIQAGNTHVAALRQAGRTFAEERDRANELAASLSEKLRANQTDVRAAARRASASAIRGAARVDTDAARQLRAPRR